MSDDDCGLQSVVTPVLTSWTSPSTSTSKADGGLCDAGAGGVPFEARYLGGIPGCMNIEACNYLPIATTPDTCYPGRRPRMPQHRPRPHHQWSPGIQHTWR